MERERLAGLTREQKRKFSPIVPDFVIELISPTDRLAVLRKKMEVWIANGVKLGWLLDVDRTAYSYRLSREPEKRIEPRELQGDDPVSGFVLELAEIWNPNL